MTARPAPRWVWRLPAAVLEALAAVAEAEGWGTVRWDDQAGAADALAQLAAGGDHPSFGWYRRYGAHVVRGPSAGTLREVAGVAGRQELAVRPDVVAELADALRNGWTPTLGWWQRALAPARRPD